jgi:hypothetical protein
MFCLHPETGYDNMLDTHHRKFSAIMTSIIEQIQFVSYRQSGEYTKLRLATTSARLAQKYVAVDGGENIWLTGCLM